jgi:uncharacterized protein (DUF362 family)/ferredoxin
VSETTNGGTARVALVACREYDREKVQAAVDRCIELLGGPGELVHEGDRVLVKPNMLMGFSPTRAVTTHPEVLRAVLGVVKAAGGKAEVGDSPMFMKTDAALRRCELSAPVEELGGTVADFEKAAVLWGPESRTYRRFDVAACALEPDVLINICKLKTHGCTGLTMSIKNLFGLIPGLEKSRWHLKAPSHADMSSMLVDLFEALQAHWKDRTRVLHVCDGVIGQDGEGPGPAGRPRTIGVVAASYDAVALDAVLTRVVGFGPDQVSTTVIAADRGLGVADLDHIEVVGDRIEDVCLPPGDFEPNRGSLRSGMLRWPMTTKFMRDRMVQRPVIVAEKCEGCGECRKVCAAKAITLVRTTGLATNTPSPPGGGQGGGPEDLAPPSHRPSPGESNGQDVSRDKKARIDHGVCIRCYCCIEVCKYEAARLGPRPLLARAIDHRRTLAWIGLGLVLTGVGVAASCFIL